MSGSARWDDENSTNGFSISLSILWFFLIFCAAGRHLDWIPSPTPKWLIVASITVFLFSLNEWLNVCFNAVWRRERPKLPAGMRRSWWQFEWVGGSVRYGIDYWRRKPIHWVKIVAVSLTFWTSVALAYAMF